MPSIFVSYRRTDAGGHAGRLYDQLVVHFPEGSVFRDRESLEAGDDFAEVIEGTVARCDVLVAVIGPGWLDAKEGRRRRLHDPHDWVRLEIANALQRDIPVVPVLVGGATMPSATKLPEDLRPIARRHAVALNDTAWAAQVQQLISVLSTWVPAASSGPLAPLRTLVDAQIRAADDFPYVVYRSRRPALSALYVRQQLSEHREAGEDNAEPVDPIATTEAPAMSVDNALAQHRHVLIQAGPGQGKSVLTLQLAAQRAREWKHDQRQRLEVPLRVTARRLAAEQHKPWDEALIGAASADLGAHLNASLPDDVFSERVAKQWLILVDGLDEVSDPDARAALINVLAGRLRESDSRLRLLITSRPLAGHERRTLADAGIGEFDLEPFDTDALTRFAQQWFVASDGAPTNATADRFLHQVSDHPVLRVVTSVPLLATIAAVVFEEDPERPLPTNRHTLYSRFISQLLDNRAAPEEWDRLRDRLRAWPDADPLISRLMRRRKLLEHLARVRVTSERSLRAEFGRWLHGPADDHDVPGWWEEAALAVVTGTGLLVGDGGELDFLHRSFAEHLAAGAIARELPQQLTDAPDATTWIDLAAAGADFELARSVLVHHTRAHPENGLLEWLFAHARPRLRLLGAQLLGEGVEPADCVRAALVETCDTWLRTGDAHARWLMRLAPTLPADDALDELIARAAMNPALAWSIRWLAGETLSGLGERAADRAAAAWHTFAADTRLAAWHRSSAASRLADLGAAYADRTAEAFQAIAADPEVSGTDRLVAADELDALGSDYREHAATALTRLIGEHTRGDLDEDLDWLEEDVDEPQTSDHWEAIGGLRDLSSFERRWSAERLYSFGGAYEERAVAALEAAAGDAALEAEDRRDLAKLLEELDLGYRPRTHALLVALAGDERVSGAARRVVAEEMVEMGDEFRVDAIAALRALAVNRNTEAWERRLAAEALARHAPEHLDDAVLALEALLDDPAVDRRDQDAALLSLAELERVDLGDESIRARIAGLLEAAILDPPQGWEAHRVAHALARLGTEYSERAAQRLEALSADPHADAMYRLFAAEAIEVLGAAYVDRAALALERLILEPPESSDLAAPTFAASDEDDAGLDVLPLTGSDRQSAAESLYSFGGAYEERAVAALETAADDAALEAEDRRDLAKLLEELDPGYRPRTHALLVALARDERVSGAARRVVAEEMVHMGDEFRIDGIAALRALAVDRTTQAWERRLAAETLAYHAPQHLREATATLEEIAADPAIPHVERHSAADALSALGSDYRERAIAALSVEADTDPSGGG